jgi:hypothetical protein
MNQTLQPMSEEMRELVKEWVEAIARSDLERSTEIWTKMVDFCCKTLGVESRPHPEFIDLHLGYEQAARIAKDAFDELAAKAVEQMQGGRIHLNDPRLLTDLQNTDVRPLAGMPGWYVGEANHLQNQLAKMNNDLVRHAAVQHLDTPHQSTAQNGEEPVKPNQTLYAASPATFTTVSGRRINLLAPKPDDIDRDDLAHHLAGVPRYGGSLSDRVTGDPVFYTVAEHSVYVMAAALEGGVASFPSPQVYLTQALHALMHDAPEAYCGDATSPLKAAMRAMTAHGQSHYDMIELDLAHNIAWHFGIPTDRHIAEATKTADVRVFAAETVALRRLGRDDFADHTGGVDLFDNRWTGPIRLLSPRHAKRLFARATRMVLENDYARLEQLVDLVSDRGDVNSLFLSLPSQ